jgi:hypothetical protein
VNPHNFKESNMSWSDADRRKATPNEKFTIEGAVEYFRAENLERVQVGGPCPYCKMTSLEFHQVDEDERIELGIGRYLIGRCRDCDSFCVVFGRVDAKKDRVVEARKSLEEAGLLRPPCTREEFRALMDGWCKQNNWFDSNGRPLL